jgi:hypothetical protein
MVLLPLDAGGAGQWNIWPPTPLSSAPSSRWRQRTRPLFLPASGGGPKAMVVNLEPREGVATKRTDRP